MNPKIIEDVWGVTIFAMGVAGLVTYAITRPATIRPMTVVLGFLSLGGLLALTGDVLSPGSPASVALLARLLFIGFFVGCSGAIGWGMARVLLLRSHIK
jgi:hypothetical protein